MFRRNPFLDEARIVAAIRAAEGGTSGELRVSVDPHGKLDPKEAAAKAFLRMGMHHTRHRNGILFLVQPHARRFAVIGDRGIHGHVGQAFWDELSDLLREHFTQGRFTEGLEAAIAVAGRRLAEHFPPDQGNPDELPDTVDRG